jgi:hypothetical protein
MGQTRLDAPTVDATLGVVLKYQDDIARVRGAEAKAILSAVSPGRDDGGGRR